MNWKNRHSVLGVLFCVYLLCYMDRMVIATALPFIAEEFSLSPLAMGGVMSAFFVGYAVMQIPGGLLADRFGPRIVITAAIVGWSFFTALTGAAGSLVALLAVRVLFGIAEGPYPSAASKTIAMSFPPGEVGKANGIQLASVNIGAAIAPLIVAPLLAASGWRSVFYWLLVPGLMLALAVWVILRGLPRRPEGVQRGGVPTESEISFAQILKMPPLLWCAATLFFANIASWGLMNWLPTYLHQARGFDLAKTGVYASMPFLAGALGYFLGGILSDRFFSDKRQVPIAIGLILSACMTYIAAIAPTGELATAALVLVFLFFFISLSGIFTLPLVLVPPRSVGGVFGIVNTVGQVAAFLSPLLIGYILTISDNDFSYVFYCLVGLFLIASCASMRIKSRARGAFQSC